MKSIANQNLHSVQYKSLFLPIFILIGLLFFLLIEGNFSTQGYVFAQKELFFYLNRKLSQFQSLQYNITQLGDAFVALSLSSIFIIYAPQIWKSLLPASLFSLLFAQGLKNLFDIPRPATILGAENINIIGKTLVGYSSMPSGHSITIFSVFTILILAFKPQKLTLKIPYLIFANLILILFALSRVAVGAHHPFDVLIGSCLGYISAILGIILGKKIQFLTLLFSKKAYPFFIIVFAVAILILLFKIIKENLLIFYFPVIILLVSLQKMIRQMIKKPCENQ